MTDRQMGIKRPHGLAHWPNNKKEGRLRKPHLLLLLQLMAKVVAPIGKGDNRSHRLDEHLHLFNAEDLSLKRNMCITIKNDASNAE